MPTNINIDRLNPSYALEGQIVTMNGNDQVLRTGRVYVEGHTITAVLDSNDPTPPDLQAVPVLKTGGTIYPGLIELHNHLSYNALKLWQVPERFTNRDQWAGRPAYRKLISGPMTVLGKTTGYVEAIVRYVECKCLLGGVTTSQGIKLYSNPGIQTYYKGIVRNVEDGGDPKLPSVDGHIADVEANNAPAFLARLRRGKGLLLHLSEGTDNRSRQHFADLFIQGTGEWAITEALSGIHCVALAESDFVELQSHGGSMIWSPFSNLLLYGDTAHVEFAAGRGVLIGLGSDWSPSGSKNLLGELKVVRLVSRAKGGVNQPLFSDKEIVGMATRNAAKILRWDGALGSIETDKRADLLVINGQSNDPYAALIESRETDISLVVIDGVPRYGLPRLMTPFGDGTERRRVGGLTRVLNLAQQDGNSVVGNLTLRVAADRLRDGLRRLPELARRLEIEVAPTPDADALARMDEEPSFTLVLDQDEPDDMMLRTHFSDELYGPPLSSPMELAALAAPLSQLLEPLTLDPLTVVDDMDFLDRVEMQPNLPPYVRDGLRGLY